MAKKEKSESIDNIETEVNENNETIKKDESLEWIERHNVSEIIETDKLNILPEFNIDENDFTTIRTIIIDSKPYKKFDIPTKTRGILPMAWFINIKENGILKVLWFESIVLQRSYIRLAKKLTEKTGKEVKSEKDIDFNLIKVCRIHRIFFTDKLGKDNQALELIEY